MNGVEEFDAEVKGSSDLSSGIVEEAKNNRGDESAGNGGYKEVGIDGSVINSSLDLKLGWVRANQRVGKVDKQW